MMRTPRSRRATVIWIAVLVSFAGGGTAVAHGPRIPFAEWGAFSAPTGRCQRIIAREAARCAASAWRLRGACRRTDLLGGTCNQPATNAAITAARVGAYDAIAADCETDELDELSFLGLFDLEADVIDFCRSWEDEAASAVYGPFDASLTPTEQRCAEAAAAATTAMMRFTFRDQRQCLDRIVETPMDLSARQRLLAHTAARGGAAQGTLSARIAARCDAATFETIYGRTPATFVSDLMRRAACVAGRLYIQDAVLCPAAECGNGIVEVPETCDDANTVDGDRCPADCSK